MTPTKHSWTFKRRFRRHAFGWRSQPAIGRIKEAVSEIKKVRRTDPVLAAEGAVAFLERVSPALEHVDSSSGAIGSAVNRAIDQLVPIIAEAHADDKTRRGWLDRLMEALENDHIPYIEHLGDSWGDVCATKAIASEQADQLLDLTRIVLRPNREPGESFVGTSPCLSALHKAERYDELVEIAGGEHVFWWYKRWAIKALVAQGRKSEAIRLAEASRGPWSSDLEIDQLGEEILLSSGMVEEAYRRYGLSANGRGTYLATYRAVAAKYPSKDPTTILEDLVRTTPGNEGKWFAAAKSVGLFDRSPRSSRGARRAIRRRSPEPPATSPTTSPALRSRPVSWRSTGWWRGTATTSRRPTCGQRTTRRWPRPRNWATEKASSVGCATSSGRRASATASSRRYSGASWG